jgi:serine/threonine-protein kinase ULK4
LPSCSYPSRCWPFEKMLATCCTCIWRPQEGWIDSPPTSTKLSVVLSKSLWHLTDLAVRPIMLNWWIEKVPESNFDTRALPVDPLLVVEFVKLQPEQLEKLLNCILASIQGNTTMNEKLNILKYLESLCTNLEASNILINGPLMPFLVKML